MKQICQTKDHIQVDMFYINTMYIVQHADKQTPV